MISIFDKESTGSLNKEEFATFIVSFSKTVNIELIDMLDFMLVVTSLKGKAEAEKEYMHTLKTEKYRYWYG